jgi:hypothetical protein
MHYRNAHMHGCIAIVIQINYMDDMHALQKCTHAWMYYNCNTNQLQVVHKYYHLQ